MHRFGLSSLAALGLAAAAGATPAAAYDVRPLGKLGFDFGGDKLVTAYFTDGSTKSLYANEGFFAGAGVSIRDPDSELEIEAALSFKASSITASNGDVTWVRWPLDLLAFYRQPSYRVGAGVTFHLHPRVRASGAAAGADLQFSPALGLLLQADYLLRDNVALGARYTNIEYRLTDGGASARSDGIGIVFSVDF